MTTETFFLAITAAAIGVVHTVLGPDHYIPFVALARARAWSRRWTIVVTLLCGLGHILGSLALGVLAAGLGWSMGNLEWLEGVRGNVAGWMLLGFGVAYTAWGLRRAHRGRRHTHWHAHHQGDVHHHEHTHLDDHAHVHEAGKLLTPWVLFTIFVFGPCEPLVPLLMAPAVAGNMLGLVLVIGAFATATLGTMLFAVLFLLAATGKVEVGSLARYRHALAGGALVVCGLAIQLGL